MSDLICLHCLGSISVWYAAAVWVMPSWHFILRFFFFFSCVLVQVHKWRRTVCPLAYVPVMVLTTVVQALLKYDSSYFSIVFKHPNAADSESLFHRFIFTSSHNLVLLTRMMTLLVKRRRITAVSPAQLSRIKTLNCVEMIECTKHSKFELIHLKGELKKEEDESSLQENLTAHTHIYIQWYTSLKILCDSFAG